MKRLFVFLATAFVFTACNNDNAANDAATKDPSEVHPPSEALPDTLQLINDSVVVADPSADPGVKAKVGSSDSIQRKQ
jgi:hypothetical protein